MSIGKRRERICCASPVWISDVELYNLYESVSNVFYPSHSVQVKQLMKARDRKRRRVTHYSSFLQVDDKRTEVEIILSAKFGDDLARKIMHAYHIGKIVDLEISITLWYFINCLHTERMHESVTGLFPKSPNSSSFNRCDFFYRAARFQKMMSPIKSMKISNGAIQLLL